MTKQTKTAIQTGPDQESCPIATLSSAKLPGYSQLALQPKEKRLGVGSICATNVVIRNWSWWMIDALTMWLHLKHVYSFGLRRGRRMLRYWKWREDSNPWTNCGPRRNRKCIFATPWIFPITKSAVRMKSASNIQLQKTNWKLAS